MDAGVARERLSLEALHRRYLTASALFHLAAAESVDLAATDYRATTLLELDGPLSNGELARRLHLSTGATTRLVDRLEARGLVHRTVAADDRRRTLIAHSGTPPAGLDATVQAVREPVGRAIEGLTPEQQGGLRTYLEAATTAFVDAARSLSDER